ncbi:MAG: hypothetical protein ACOC92_02340 [bacterium]
MADRPRVVLFCEDPGHEQFVRALVGRLAGDLGLRPTLQTPSARGGHGRALREFDAWQDGFARGRRQGFPELLVLAIDCNCTAWNKARRDLEQAIDQACFPNHVVACPDPHVERWYMADPAAFQEVVGARPGRDPGKCDRNAYKQLVEDAVSRAALPLVTGIPDLAPDLVTAMDLYRAAKSQPSLGHFIDGLGAALRRLAGP